MIALYIAAAAIFALAAVLAVIRVVLGPTLLDRMIASDVLLSILLLVVGAEMVFGGHTRNLVIMLVIAATASFATIAVARYVAQQAPSRREADE